MQWDFSTYNNGGTLVREWVLSSWITPEGAEGLTFVPDSYLQAQGFTDQSGNPYTSTQGMGGLMLIGYQGGGHLSQTLTTAFEHCRIEVAQDQLELASRRISLHVGGMVEALALFRALGSLCHGQARQQLCALRRYDSGIVDDNQFPGITQSNPY